MSDGGSANQINALAQMEIAAATDPRDPDAADERAERKTMFAGTVVGVFAAIGATWFIAGELTALIVAGIAALITAAFAIRWRMAINADRPRNDPGLD